MRLGEMLIHKSLIDEDQLEQALGAQLIYGGHLGTCLIEMGYLDEAQLGHVLAELFEVECATKEDLSAASRFVIAKLTDQLVRKHFAVPFRLTDKTLEVAMVDPTNLYALDELSFASGHRIQSWVAPEARIYQAMEQHYDIPRRQRYVALCRRLDQDEPRVQRNYVGRTVSLGETAVEPTGTAQRPAPRREHAFAAAVATVAVADRSFRFDSGDGDQLAEHMCRSESWDELATTVLDRIACSVPRSILFRVKNRSAFVWKARGIDGNESTAVGLPFPVEAGSVLGLVRGSELYRGPVPEENGYADFYSALELTVPRETLVLPLYVSDRLIGVYYGDSGALPEIEGPTEDYRRLMRMFSLALNLVLLKREIRSA